MTALTEMTSQSARAAERSVSSAAGRPSPGPVAVAPYRGKKRLRIIRVILLGNISVGKTALTKRFTDGEFLDDYAATVVAEYSEREVKLDDQTYILRIVDTSGQERFNCITKNFYRGTQICLLTFSLDSLKTFCSLSKWRQEFIQFSGIDRDLDFPFIVVGNKADLDNSQKIVKDASVRAWCEANGNLPYIQTSAKTGQNVEELFTTAVEKLLEMEQQSAGPFFNQGGAIKGGKSVVDLTANAHGKQRPKCCK